MTEIIILNGTPSSGKSSIARALKDRLPDPYLLVGIDLIASTLPGRYLEPPLSDAVLMVRRDGPEPVAVPGPLGHRLVSGLHHTVAALAGSGHRVIVDHALIDHVWVRECVRLFRDRSVLFVGVRCPLHVVEQRERSRPDRMEGMARAQFQAVHDGKAYDAEVDTSTNSPDDCAEQILRHVGRPAQSRLFDVDQYSSVEG